MLPSTRSLIHSRIFIQDLSQALFNVLEIRNTVGWEKRKVGGDRVREGERERDPACLCEAYII